VNAMCRLRLVGSVIAVLALPLALSAPALGDGGGDITLPPPSTPAPPQPPDTSTGDVGGTGGGSDTRGGCAVVAGPSYLGVSCAGAQDRGGKTVKEILGDDPVPGCWDDPVPEDQLAKMGRHNEPGAGGLTWYWERCLTGIDKQTKKVEPGGIKIDVTLVSIENGDHVKTLTANQAALVKPYEKTAGVPPPLAGVTPSAHPHVGQWVSFVDTTGDEVDVPAGAVTLRARLTSIDVEPLGAGNGTISCPGTGVVASSGDAPPQAGDSGWDPLGWDADGCWYKYTHSSADQPDETYPVQVTAHWTAETSVGGGAWAHLADFTKSQVTNIPVTEIQTLVVD
jgi:hypothetical protein